METSGSGEPLVLVHGALTDHTTWGDVAGLLSASFRVVTYDRRGHSCSERAYGPRSTHEDDLGALIEAVAGGPAHVAGTSYGGSIALGLVSRRPHLVRSVIAHEPPLLSVAERNSQLEAQVRSVKALLNEVVEHLRTGETMTGVVRFIEEVTVGPDMWEQLPLRVRETMVDNAPTLLASLEDPEWADLDTQALPRTSRRILLTQGRRSPSWFAALMSEIAHVLGGVDRHTFPCAGHVPHLTHPSEFIDRVRSFCD